MDEMICDVIPIDCMKILVGIHFIYDRKDNIIPLKDKFIVSKGDEPFVIHAVLTSRASSLFVNKA